MGKRSSAQFEPITKKRKSITLQTKYDIIKDKEAGMSITALESKYSLSKSTICTIIKDKEKIIEEVQKDCPLQSTRVRSKETSSLIPRLENLLTAWIADQSVKIPMTQRVICAKAISLFKMLKGDEGVSDETFVASNGWFYRFKNRAGWYNNKIQEKPKSDNNKAVKSHQKELEVHQELVDHEAKKLPVFTIEKLEEAFANVKKACDIFESQDSNFERSKKVINDLNKSIHCYRIIYNEMKKKSLKKNYIKKKKRS